MFIEVQLFAAISPGTTKVPEMLHPHCSGSPFMIPKDGFFVATDISASRLSVIATPVLAALSLQQTVGTVGTVAHWQFVGQIAQNIERAFTTGIRFSAPFSVQLLSSSGDGFNIRIHGFFV